MSKILTHSLTFGFLIFLGLVSIKSSAQLSNSSCAQSIDSLSTVSYSEFAKNLYQYTRDSEHSIKDCGKEIRDIDVLAKLYTNLGIAYHLLKKSDKSLSYYMKSIEIYSGTGNRLGLGKAYTEMGYGRKEDDLKSAIAYMKKGIEILDGQNNDEAKTSAYDNLGVLMDMSGKSDSAIYFYNEALIIRKAINDQVGMVYSLLKISAWHTRLNDFPNALITNNEALTIAEDIGDTVLIAEAHTYFGDLYYHKTELNESIRHYEKALAIAEQHKIDYLRNYIYKTLPQVYYDKNEVDRAYELLVKSNLMRDSIYTLERQRNVTELESTIEHLQKNQEIAELKQANLLNKLKAKQNKYLAIVGALASILLLMFFLLFIIRQKLKQKSALALQKEQLQKQRLAAFFEAEEKERKRIAQDLHDGVGQYVSASKMTLSALGDDLKGNEIYGKAVALLNQSIDELRNTSHDLLPKEIEHKSFISAVESLIQDVNASSQLKIKLDNRLTADFTDKKVALHLFRILQELINNSIKHSSNKEVEITLTQNHQRLAINYRDMGSKIDKRMIDQSKGIGWKNIYSRVEIINGKLSFVDEDHCTCVSIEVES